MAVGGDGRMRRSEQKRAARAQTLVGTPVLAYASGVGRARMSDAALALGAAAVAVILAVVILTGTVIYPGGLLLVVFARLIRPRLGLAVTSGGVFVAHENMGDGHPSRVVTSAPLHGISVEADGKASRQVWVSCGSERLRVRRRSLQAVLDAIAAAGGMAAASGPAGAPGTATVAEPWAGTATVAEPWAGTGAAVALQPAAAAPGGLPPAAWCADPTGRHQVRYWDGSAWTGHVADAGVAGLDPLR